MTPALKTSSSESAEVASFKEGRAGCSQDASSPKTRVGAEGSPAEVEELIPANDAVTSKDQTKPAEPEQQLKVYKLRWFVLAVISLLNMSNAASWIAYAPVANYTGEFYGKNAANWLSMIFLFTAVPVAFLAMWSEQRFGLRLAILFAACSNAVGAVIRLLSSFSLIGESGRFAIVMLGQGVAACAYPFIMFLPTKVSGAWFPSSQRTIANTIATLSNPIGVLLANVVAPQIVTHVSKMVFLNLIVAVPAVLTCVMAVVGIRSSGPSLPPTMSAATQAMGFFDGLKKLMKSQSFLLLFVTLGAGIGMFNALYTVMQQILCPKGYSNEFSGVCCALMICAGLVGATISGIVVDKTKRFEEVMKIAFGLAVLAGIGLIEAVIHGPDLHAVVALACLAFGFFGLAELGAECTFPVAATTSSGMIVLSGQLQALVYIMLIQNLAEPVRPRDRDIEVCTVTGQGGDESAVEAYNMTRPLLVFVGIGAVLICIFITVFKPKYRRLKLENSAAAKQNQNIGANVSAGGKTIEMSKLN